ncbi:hypothetical protein NPIL_563951 [Nephila pilipes]|uniref:Uncharacterized protein n=1 Tax=Nephila pilipes TaxID=299642 RepID=A0A8X6U678_NEPPI|nr:hypothetical protein NPIL_563951 [Nephila pilipes]
MSKKVQKPAIHRPSNSNWSSRHPSQYSRTKGVRTSPKISCYSSEREGHIALICPYIAPQKSQTRGTAQCNTITTAKPRESQEYPYLTAKLSDPVEATTNLAELLTTSARNGSQRNCRLWFLDSVNTQRSHPWSTI